MFLEFYKLREQPFGVTPDPRYLYLGNAHRRALAHLLYSIETKRGFSALIAEPGMGKTSLLFQILDSLQDSARTAFLFQTVEDSRELLRCLLYDLAIKCASEDPSLMREALNANLLQELRSGKQVIVVIDEAQNLDDKILETIRQLSNFETAKQKLMHIVLAGQPGLAAKLSDGSMTQLRQRISNIVRLEPFRGDEVDDYIEHRLQTAGLQGPSMFSPGAIELIAQTSQGIPRNINNICFQALSIGYARQSPQIDAPIVRDVISELQSIAPLTKATTRRAAAPVPPRAVPRQAEPVHLGQVARLGAWDDMPVGPRRSSFLKWIAGLTCLVALPAAMIALSDTRLGLSDTLPGQISERVMSAVLGTSNGGAPQTAQTQPDVSRSAAPIPSAASQASSPSLPAPADAETTPGDKARDTESPNADALREKQNISGSTVSSNSDSNEKGGRTKSAKPAPDTLMANNQNHDRPRSGAVRDVPTTVQVLRPETVFQLAVELYGHSNWIIVEAIRAANPEIRDPYAVLSVGQIVRLPSDLVTVTQDYNNSHNPAAKRSR